MASCGKGTLTREHPHKPQRWQYLAATCKKLSCPSCGPKKKSQYRAAIFRLRKEHRLQRHIVLTLDPGLIPADRSSIEYIQQVWARFRTYLHDKRNLSLTYIRTIEVQENGTAHFHLIISETISQENLINWWVACGGGHQCRIRFRDGNRGAHYITKYVTKELVTPLPPGTRRVATSKGLRLFEPKAPSGWEWNSLPMWVHVANAYTLNVNALEVLPQPEYFESESPPLDNAEGTWAPPRTPEVPTHMWVGMPSSRKAPNAA